MTLGRPGILDPRTWGGGRHKDAKTSGYQGKNHKIVEITGNLTQKTNMLRRYHA